MPKSAACPRPLSRVGRETGPADRILQGPVHPVMNSVCDVLPVNHSRLCTKTCAVDDSAHMEAQTVV